MEFHTEPVVIETDGRNLTLLEYLQRRLSDCDVKSEKTVQFAKLFKTKLQTWTVLLPSAQLKICWILTS